MSSIPLLPRLNEEKKLLLPKGENGSLTLRIHCLI